MKPEKDRQQAVKLLLYLAEIAVLTAAVFLVVRFLPGGGRPWNRLPESGTLAETLPELSKPQEESGEADVSSLKMRRKAEQRRRKMGRRTAFRPTARTDLGRRKGKNRRSRPMNRLILSSRRISTISRR